MIKPFSIQAPEEIAKQYGGDKAKIAQAAQMGVLDPTAAVLAGMFIDKMRSAAQVEQAPRQTVAQQVMAPQPQMPPMQAGIPQQAAPQMPMGGAPQAAPQMPQAPGMADGGMVPPYASGGGLSDAPIPATMFDEPDNGGYGDGYAVGGLVAFGDGGSAGRHVGPWLEEQAVGAIPGIGITSRQRSAAHNAQVGGVPHSYHLTNDARDFVPPKGMGMGALHKQLASLYGSGYDVINEGDHIHVEPGSRRAAPAKAPLPAAAVQAAPILAAPPPAAASAPTPAAPQGASVADIMGLRDDIAALGKQRSDDLADARRDRRQATWMGLAQQGLGMLGPQALPEGFAMGGGVRRFAEGEEVTDDSPITVIAPQTDKNYYGFHTDPNEMRASIENNYKPEHEAGNALMDYFKNITSDAGQKQRRKEDMWYTLAQLGATMASTPGSLLQAASAGINKALPGAQEAAKERRGEQRSAIMARAQQEGLNNKEALDFEKLVLEGTGKAGEFDQTKLNREQQERLEYYRQKMENARAQMQANATLEGHRISAAATRDAANAGVRQMEKQMQNQAYTAAKDAAAKDSNYFSAVSKGDVATANAIFNQYYQANLQMLGMGGGAPAPSGGGGGNVVTVPWKP